MVNRFLPCLRSLLNHCSSRGSDRRFDGTVKQSLRFPVPNFLKRFPGRLMRMLLSDANRGGPTRVLKVLARGSIILIFELATDSTATSDPAEDSLRQCSPVSFPFLCGCYTWIACSNEWYLVVMTSEGDGREVCLVWREGPEWSEACFDLLPLTVIRNFKDYLLSSRRKVCKRFEAVVLLIMIAVLSAS